MSPLLWGLSVKDLGDLPLAMFQCTTCEKDDLRKLLRSIAASSTSGVDAELIDGGLNQTWAWFSAQVGQIATAPATRARESAEDGTDDEVTLDYEEEQILTILAGRYQEGVCESDLAKGIGEPAVRIRSHLDRLVNLGLLEEDRFSDEDGLYELTEAGRRLVVDYELDR